MSWFLPTMYRSEALILIEQQMVPEQYVVPNNTASLQDRLQTITQQILSRTRLQATIDRYGLYHQRRDLIVSRASDAVEAMRKDIEIEQVRADDHPGELAAFKIDYSAATPELAQRINTELTSFFIDENLKSQQEQAKNTTAFLESQLETAQSQLEAQETAVQAFKEKHFGDLPGQLESNVQILTGLQGQLDNNQRALDAARQQKIYLESQLQQYQMSEGKISDGETALTSPEILEQQLLDLRTRLADARLRYTEDFPDVISLRQKIGEIEKMKKEAEDEVASTQKAAQTAKASGGAPTDEIHYDSSTPIMQVRSQLKANELEIQTYQRHSAAIESQIATYRARLNITPEIEQQLANISRGYEESKANYDSLLQKKNQSELATSLEQQQQGQQFRIVDPPSLPKKPSFPNHFLVSMVGVALGIGLGLGIAILKDVTESRIWNEEGLQGVVPGGRVLVSIPHLSTEREEKYRRVFRSIEVAAALTMAVATVAGNLFALYKG